MHLYFPHQKISERIVHSIQITRESHQHSITQEIIYQFADCAASVYQSYFPQEANINLQFLARDIQLEKGCAKHVKFFNFIALLSTLRPMIFVYQEDELNYLLPAFVTLLKAVRITHIENDSLIDFTTCRQIQSQPLHGVFDKKECPKKWLLFFKHIVDTNQQFYYLVEHMYINIMREYNISNMLFLLTPLEKEKIVSKKIFFKRTLIVNECSQGTQTLILEEQHIPTIFGRISSASGIADIAIQPLELPRTPPNAPKQETLVPTACTSPYELDECDEETAPAQGKLVRHNTPFYELWNLSDADSNPQDCTDEIYYEL